MDSWRKGLDKDGLIAEINERPEQGLPRRRLHLLAVHPGQRPGGGLRREGRELGQDLGQRPRDAGQARQRDQERCWPPCPASPTSPCRPRSASRPSASTSTAPRRRATAWRRATSTPPCRPRSAARRRATSTRAAATATSRWSSAWRSRYRENLEAIKRIQIGVQGANGVTQVPLSEVAKVELVSGAYYIYREQQERYVPVKFSVRGRDLGSAILEAQQRVAEKVKIPGGYRIEWVGEFGNLKNALQRLADRRADRHRPDRAAALHELRLVPRHAAGRQRHPDGADRRHPGPLVVPDMPFSISAAIGFVALFGIAAMNGIMVLSCYNRLIDAGPRARAPRCYETCDAADAAGADDLHRRRRRPAARRLLDGDRQPGPAAAGHRRGRRHPAGAAALPHRAAGRDRPVLAPPRRTDAGAPRSDGIPSRRQHDATLLSRRAAALAAGALAGCIGRPRLHGAGRPEDGDLSFPTRRAT